jgi:hypothetical protein
VDSFCLIERSLYFSFCGCRYSHWLDTDKTLAESPHPRMNVPAAEPIANIACTITGSPSGDTANGEDEAEMVELGAKGCDGTNWLDARKARELVSVSV